MKNCHTLYASEFYLIRGVSIAKYSKFLTFIFRKHDTALVFGIKNREIVYILKKFLPITLNIIFSSKK